VQGSELLRRSVSSCGVRLASPILTLVEVGENSMLLTKMFDSLEKLYEFSDSVMEMFCGNILSRFGARWRWALAMRSFEEI
jgi:hypothetical protein